MKNKKGFIATSLIYSFFLVFLMLMMTILVASVNNRIFVDRINEDIKSELENQGSFIVDTLPAKNYNIGESETLANESWQVIEDKGSQVVLVLARALTKEEIIAAIGEDGNTQIYGTCNDSSCQVRACFNASTSVTGGQLYCWLYGGNTNLYRIPSWNPTTSRIQSQNYGQTIVSAVVRSWFNTHRGVQRLLSKKKLVEMNINDGALTTKGYVRIPMTSEVSNTTNANKWANVQPFHLLEKNSNIQTRIYNTSMQNVNSNTAAYIRPVIEVYEG